MTVIVEDSSGESKKSMLPDEAEFQLLVDARIATGQPMGSHPAKLNDVHPMAQPRDPKAAELVLELAEVNRRWRVHGNVPIASDRRFVSRSIKRAVRKGISWYVDGLARMQSDFNASTARVLNALSDTVRSLQRALATEVTGRARETAALRATIDELARQLEAQGTETARRDAQMRNVLDLRLVGIEAKVSQIDEWAPDWLFRHREVFDYKAFQNEFRGNEDDIASRQYTYLADLVDVSGPVVDLGCGRGEFLRLCRRQGLPAIGIDVDVAEVSALCSEGFDARVADALDFLTTAPNNAFGALTLFQVAEHLPVGRTIRIIREAQRVLSPNGILIIETINPESLYVFSHALFVDPTHLRPIHPLMLKFTMSTFGFDPVSIRYRSPVLDSERLLMDPDATAAEVQRIEVLNQQLFGPQEYAVVGRKAQ